MHNTTFVHKYLKPLIKGKRCIDMTAGNGNDTYFLAKDAKEVVAIDIDKTAILNTKKRLKDFDNVQIINDNHIHIAKYLTGYYDVVIFNLGYLPKSDNPSITKPLETLKAIQEVINYLDGYLVITFYRGHNGGMDEYYLIDKYLKDNHFKIIETYQKHQSLIEPITYIIKRP